MANIIIAIIGALASIMTACITSITNKKIKKIDELKIEQDKTYLTDYLTEVENEVKKSEIQKARACEIYDEYTKLGGNSYIHNKWNELKERKLL